MRVWAVANQKGGVGKTTTAVNIAGLLAAAGRRTLLIDLDPHGSLTSYFGHDPDTIQHSAYQLFQDNSLPIRELILSTDVKGMDLLPASSALATLDRQLGTQQGKGLVIVNALKKLQQEYSYVLIDCPPVLGVLMVNALATCHRLLIPVQTEFLALKGLERIIHTLNMIMQSQHKKLPFTIIPTMYDKRTNASLESLMTLKETYPYTLWEEVIPVDTQFRETSKLGVPLTLANTKSRGAIAYRRLLAHLLRITYEQQVKQAAVS